MFSRSETDEGGFTCGWSGAESCFDPATKTLMVETTGQPVHYCARHAEQAITNGLAVEAETPKPSAPKPGVQEQGGRVHFEGRKHFPGDGCCT